MGARHKGKPEFPNAEPFGAYVFRYHDTFPRSAWVPSWPENEMLATIRAMGQYVIPKIDTHPVHRTTKLREAAAGRVG